MIKIIKKLYYNELISYIFHTVVYCLKRELKDCHSVLDLGCGKNSPVQYCNVPYSVGVDIFKPYIKISKGKKIHNDYILADITRLNFKPNSFDAVILIDVLEHLPKEEGERLLDKVELWARNKIIITTPNGFVPQKDIDQNPFQKHRSGWTIEEFKKRGYRVYGLAGWKFLRRENIVEDSNAEDSILSTIRFKPRILWFIISAISQIITYYFPRYAFELFCVKNLNKFRHNTFNLYIYKYTDIQKNQK